ncbi:xylose isomerase [Bradyrhizobium sp. CCBAU 45394]|uniref:sugar phosphate isomerase/epimerase family protein n=1 Tax=unclassified Bradyrhizobium TaxID=2631580 RepID=UPI002302198C|nr:MULTISPECIES: TIM barrel protein [unclassified Bradyrhizobium]MDA9389884.1 xylose isomerase [Bradyrhizobium sp. CCBAU 45394]MDA9540148.1 xylose isomerase [Bradyrhizobium sp. CCBAU 21362]
MTDLGLAHLTALNLAPVALVAEAARAGFSFIGLRAIPATAGGPAYPTRMGTDAHRELKRSLAGEGVRLNEIEFVQLTPRIDIPALAGLFEAAADLGAVAVTASGDDDDPVRLTAHFADLCDLAQQFGLRVDLEFMRWRAIGSLPQAVAIVRGAGKANGTILVDALHLHRCGGKPGDLISIPAHYLRAAQICDVVADMPASDAAIIAEAREGRLPPGEGALPLGALLAALPVDASLSVEMPLPALAVRPRLATAFNATRRLLEHQPRGASRPDHRREAGGPIQIRTT